MGISGTFFHTLLFVCPQAEFRPFSTFVRNFPDDISGRQTASERSHTPRIVW